MFNNSFVVSGGNTVEYGEYEFDKTIKNCDLFVVYPKQQINDNIKGYWIASSYETSVRAIFYNQSADQWGVSYYRYDDNRLSARPVVSLPITTNIELVNGVWTVIK